MIVLIAGLMGSGKTTIMASLARAMVAQRALSVSVLFVGGLEIENRLEIAPGVPAHSLVGSCVSRQLGAMLAENVLDIQQRETPDVILIELPAAELNAARVALRATSGLASQALWALAVVDTCGPEQLHVTLEHLFTAMVLAAEVLVLNRADRCTQQATGDLLSPGSTDQSGNLAGVCVRCSVR